MRIVTLIILFTLITNLGFAQRKKSKQRKKEKIEATIDELFPEERKLKIEATLIEAEKQLILENDEKAIELFKAVLDLDPADGAANFKLAETLTKKGQITEALPYSQAALDGDRTNKYYFLLTAEIYKTLGDFDKAASLYDEMINSIKGTDSYLFDLAVIYQYRGDTDRALETYQKAQDIFGVNEIVLREKQKIYLQRKDYESLIKDWDLLIEDNPDNPRYVIELSEFLVERGLLEEAKVRLNKVSEENVRIELLKSRIAQKEGNPEEAQRIKHKIFNSESVDHRIKIQILNGYMESAISPEEFRAVIDMAKRLGDSYPEEFEAQAYAGDVLYRMEEKKAALDYYLKAVTINPSTFSVWQNILNIEAELNRYETLTIHAEEALVYFPNQALLYYFAGTGHMVNQNYKKAVYMLNQGTKYSSDPNLLTVFYGQLGDAYNSLKDQRKSYESYEKALKYNPLNDHVLNNYSYFLSLDKKELEKAETMSTKLVTLHPDNPTYLDTHGWVLYTAGRYEEAETFLMKAAAADSDGTVIEHYGDVLYKLGRIEEAVAQWEKASKLSGASELIKKKIADKKLYE